MTKRGTIVHKCEMVKWMKERNIEVLECTESLPEDIGDTVGLDLETVPDGHKLTVKPICITLSDRPDRGMWIDTTETPEGEKGKQMVQRLLDTDRKIIMHTAKLDTMTLENGGINFNWANIEDVMLEAYCLDTTISSQMKAKVAQKLGINHPQWSTEIYRNSKLMREYSTGDACLHKMLHDAYAPQLAAEKKELSYKIERLFTPILVEMERRGVRIDRQKLVEMDKSAENTEMRMRKAIWQLAGQSFNIDAPQQVGAILFDKLKLPSTVKTKKGKPSTNKEALKALRGQHKIVDLILLVRAISHLRSTHIKGILEHTIGDRVHADFYQSTVPTKRLAAVNPSLLNQPKKPMGGLLMREAFIPSEGHYMIACDASQIEFRLLIYSCKGVKLINDLEGGKDFHRSTGKIIKDVLTERNNPPETLVKDDRDRGKTFNYALPYGMGAGGLAGRLNISKSQAKEIFNIHRSTHSQIYTWIDEEQEKGLQTGWTRTWTGNLRTLPVLKSKHSNRFMKMKALRNVINDQIQGGAAEIFKIAMRRVFKNKPSDWKMLLPIHDEVLLEIPNEYDHVEVCRWLRGSLHTELGEIGKYPFESSYSTKDWAHMEEIVD